MPADDLGPRPRTHVAVTLDFSRFLRRQSAPRRRHLNLVSRNRCVCRHALALLSRCVGRRGLAWWLGRRQLKDSGECYNRYYRPCFHEATSTPSGAQSSDEMTLEIQIVRICTASTISVPMEIAPMTTTVSPGFNRPCTISIFSAVSIVFCGTMKSNSVTKAVTPQFKVI